MIINCRIFRLDAVFSALDAVFSALDAEKSGLDAEKSGLNREQDYPVVRELWLALGLPGGRWGR